MRGPDPNQFWMHADYAMSRDPFLPKKKAAWKAALKGLGIVWRSGLKNFGVVDVIVLISGFAVLVALGHEAVKFFLVPRLVEV